jgi:DNA repair protein RecO (recombination protein O)
MSGTTRVELEPAYVLHARPYRETSQLLEVFTAGHGRIGLIARGARRPKSALRGILNPFTPLQLSWSGRGDLATLRQAEPGGASYTLAGDAIMAGFYVNELLIKLLHRHDPHPALFAHYASLLSSLAAASGVECALRIFELELLREAGYALNLVSDAITHQPLEPDCIYEFRFDQGPVLLEYESSDAFSFTGAELLAIGRLQFDSADRLRSAKRLLRHVVDYYLGGRALQTRKVATAMKR